MRTSLTLFSLAAALALAPSSAQAQNLLINGNLDLTTATVIVDNAPAGPGIEDFFAPKPTNWQNFGTRTISGPYEDEMSSEPWSGPAPTPVTIDGLANPPYPGGCGGGDCGVFFKPFSGSVANGPATGHLQQDVAGTPGQMYVLTGWAGAEPNALMTAAEFALEFLDAGDNVIGFDSVNLLSTLFVPNGEPFNYKQYTAVRVAPPGTVEVRVRASMIGATGNPLGGGQAFVVDDFVLLAVPEPSTLALGLAGLLCLAGLAKSRR